MTKLTLPSFSSLTNESSFIAALNEAMEAIETFSDLVLSLNGTTPNAMTADLDMNSKRLLNLPAPVGDNDAVRLIDVAEGVRGPQGDPGEPGAPGNATLSDALNAIAADTASAETLYYWDSATTGQFVTCRPFMLTLLDDDNAINARTTLGLGGAAVLNVGTSAGTVAAGDDGRFTRYTINDQSGATYTFATTDPGKLVRQIGAGAHTYTINPFATTAIPVGSVIVIRNAVGAGVLTVARGAGTFLYANGSTTSQNASLAAGAVATLIHEATDSWLILGSGIS
jgi:hypothetical protein